MSDPSWWRQGLTCPAGPRSAPPLWGASGSVLPVPRPLGRVSPRAARRQDRSDLPPVRSVSDDPEQNVQVDTSPGSARPLPAAQTPLLGHLFAAGAPSPAISLRTFGRVRGAPRTPHLLRLRAEEGCDPEAADRIEEASVGSGDEAGEP